MENFLLLSALVLAGLQVGVTHWSNKIGSDNTKKDLTKVFKDLNEEQRKKFISNLDLNKDEIIVQINKQSDENKNELLNTVQLGFKSVNVKIDNNTILLQQVVNFISKDGTIPSDELLQSKLGYNIKEIKVIVKDIINNSSSDYLKALAYVINGNDEQAINYFLKVLNGTFDDGLKIDVLFRLGNLMRKKNRTDDEIKYYQQAMKIHNGMKFHSLSSRISITRILNDFGNLILESSSKPEDLKEGVYYLDKASKFNKDLLEELGLHSELAMNLTNLGLAYKKINEYQKAKARLNEAMKIFGFLLEYKGRSIENLTGLSITYQNYGLLLRDEGIKDGRIQNELAIDLEFYFRKGYEYIDEALTVSKKEGLKKSDNLSEGISRAAHNLARYYYMFTDKFDDSNYYIDISVNNMKILTKKNKTKYTISLIHSLTIQAGLYVSRAKATENKKLIAEYKVKGLKICEEAKEYYNNYDSNISLKLKEAISELNIIEHYLKSL